MKELVRRAFRRFGFELHRSTIQTSTEAQLARIVARNNTDLVLDVGANVGLYATGLRARGYHGRIVSFEPLSSAHARLTSLAQSVSGWQVAPRMALGDTEGEVPIHIAGNSLSSSVLEMLPEHERAAPGSAFVGSESVPLHRLDHIASGYLGDAKSVLLKIDTQGYEDKVLAGASGIIDRIAAIQTELSLVPLYAGQPLFDEMRTRIESMGFELFAIFPGYVHEVTGRTLQVDGFFVRRDGLGASL